MRRARLVEIHEAPSALMPFSLCMCVCARARVRTRLHAVRTGTRMLRMRMQYGGREEDDEW